MPCIDRPLSLVFAPGILLLWLGRRRDARCVSADGSDPNDSNALTLKGCHRFR